MGRNSKHVWVSGVTAAICLAQFGCGYSMSRPFPREVEGRDGRRLPIKTIAVPIFNTKEFRRDLEFRLTEAVIKRIELETPYKVVDQKEADTILIGEVLPVKQSAPLRDFKTARPREIQLTLTVQCTWKDLRTGKILSRKEQELFTQTTDYIPPVGESFFVGSQEAIEDCAERIVEGMEKDDW